MLGQTMIFEKTEIEAIVIVEMEKREDVRGFFARAWCNEEFRARGLTAHMVQSNIAFNRKKGILRGMHYQIAPHEETKLVRCVRGAIYDVAIDLRPASPSYCRWVGVELTADSYRMVYVPEGFAHGYQTLLDNTEVFYQVSAFYSPESERGVRWNDPAFNIVWPLPVELISDKDKSWPDHVLAKC